MLPIFVQGALLTNPTASTIVLDSGPLNASYYHVEWLIMADAGIHLFFQQRNALNDTTLFESIIPIVLGGSHEALHARIRIALNERFRMLMRQDMTGQMQASLILQPSIRVEDDP